jgi:hypothetical protein
MPWRNRLRRVGIGLSICGWLLALFGAVFAPHLRLGFVAALVAFTLFVFVFSRGEAIEQALRRGTRRIVARRARLALEPLIRQAPLRIEYTLEHDQLRIEGSPPLKVTEHSLQRVRLAILAPRVICLYTGPYRQRPLAVLFYTEPDELRLVQGVLLANHVEVIALT